MTVQELSALLHLVSSWAGGELAPGGWAGGGVRGGASGAGLLGAGRRVTLGQSGAAPAAMAGSGPRGRCDSPPPPHSDWGRLEAAILSGWRSFWQSVGKDRAAPRDPREEAEEGPSTLTRLPVSVGRAAETPGREGAPSRPPGRLGPPRAPLSARSPPPRERPWARHPRR